MKQLAIIAGFCLALQPLNAQLKEGSISYESKTDLHRGIPEQYKSMVPKFTSEEHQLLFSTNASLFRVRPKEDEAPDPFGGGDKTMRTAGISYNTQLYFNFADKKSLESRELDGNPYLINKDFPEGTWKISDETKTILGYKCRKATKTDKAPEVNWTFRDKNATQAPRPATVEVVAWYTEDIPVPAGPENYNLLPGAVLEVNVDNGALVYRATEVKKSLNKKDLKEPKNGKVVTLAEFREESSKRKGGSRRINM